MLWVFVGEDEDECVDMNLGKIASMMMDRCEVRWGDCKLNSYVLFVVEELFALNEFDKRGVLVGVLLLLQ